MDLIPKVRLIGTTRWVHNPNRRNHTLFVPIECVRCSPEFYMSYYASMLLNQHLHSPQEIMQMVQETKYDEVMYEQSIPFVIDETLPSGTAYLEMQGENN